MRFIVRIPELDFALYESDIPKARHEIFNTILKLKKSGMLVDGGILADDHGGFLIVETASWNELETLVNSVFNPRVFQVEIHPILTFDNLERLFQTLENNEQIRTKQAREHEILAKKRAPVFSV